jgi:hypothetical protein
LDEAELVQVQVRLGALEKGVEPLDFLKVGHSLEDEKGFLLKCMPQQTLVAENCAVILWNSALELVYHY